MSAEAASADMMRTFAGCDQWVAVVYMSARTEAARKDLDLAVDRLQTESVPSTVEEETYAPRSERDAKPCCIACNFSCIWANPVFKQQACDELIGKGSSPRSLEEQQSIESYASKRPQRLADYMLALYKSPVSGASRQVRLKELMC